MPNDSEIAKSIFMSAVEKYSSDQWPAFLDDACGDDAALRGRVEELLKTGRLIAPPDAVTLKDL